MSAEPKDINKDDSGMFELLTQISKQNSDSIGKQAESITKLGEGQDSIAKTLIDITATLKENVHQSDNNNPTGPGLGMEQKPKVESPGDIGDKTSAPNAYAPGEYGSTGRTGPDPGKDKGGLKMENKEEKPKEEEKMEEHPKEEKKMEEHPKDEEKMGDHEKPKEEKMKEHDKPKDEEKMGDHEKPKEDKYKSYNYDDNTTIRPSIMHKSFTQYPDGYQIIKAALETGWGVEGIDAESSYTETLKRLNNYEFGTFGQVDTAEGFQ